MKNKPLTRYQILEIHCLFALVCVLCCLLGKIVNIPLLLGLAVIFMVIGLWIQPVARLIATYWMKLGDLLSRIVNPLVLSVIYYVFLVPIALAFRLVKGDLLNLKKPEKTIWITRSHPYKGKDLDNIW